MYIYLIQIALILIFPFVLGKLGYKPWKVKTTGNEIKLYKSSTVDYNAIYCFFATLILLLVIGFRTENIGLYDTANVYFPMFDEISGLSMAEVFSTYPVSRGNLFHILTKIYTYVSSNKYIWLLLCSVPFLAALCHTVRKYGNNAFVCAFAFFMICGLRIYQTNFYLIRHSIALAFLILAFDGIVDKKPIRFIVLVVISALFHMTALAFIFAYPLARVRPSWKQLVLMVIAFFAIIFMGSTLLNVLFSLLGDSYYSVYSSIDSDISSFTYAIMSGLLFAIAFFFTKRNKNTTDFDNITVNMLCIGTIMMVATFLIGEFYRIAYFYMTVSAVGLGNIIQKEKDKWLRWGTFAFLIVLYLIYMCIGLADNDLVPYETWLFS